jgi:thermitase
MKRVFLFMLALGAFPINCVLANEFVPGEVLVKYKSNTKGRTQVFKSKRAGLSLSREFFTGGQDFPISRFAVIKTKNKSNLLNLIERLNNDPKVAYAEPNYLYYTIKNNRNLQDILTYVDQDNSSAAPNDPSFTKLWGLANTGTNEPLSQGRNSSPTGRAGVDINALKAWSITKGSKSIKIAVIDTGVDYNHPDLVENIWTNTAEANGTPGVDDDGNGYIDDIHGYDFANKDGDPMDGNGHGTHCSGTIAAAHDNGVGVAGVMAHAQIIGVKFLTDQGSGSTADAILSIDYAIKQGVDIMSNSWGGSGRSEALLEAIERANAAGIIFTAAAGNNAADNDTTPSFPANYDVENVISVAAHNYDDKLASFSCFGATTVHISAPGRNILSTVNGNAYDVYSGTSMATPHVSGVVGLYLALNGKTNPKTLRDEIMRTSVYGKSYGRSTISGGRVDAYNFLTRTYPARPTKPNDNDWVNMSADLFESPHPYTGKLEVSKSYSVIGAKFIRVIIRKFDIEQNYDSLKILDAGGSVMQTIDGKGSDFTTEYIEGDTIVMKFESDSSVHEWGFEMSEIQYIK